MKTTRDDTTLAKLTSQSGAMVKKAPVDGISLYSDTELRGTLRGERIANIFHPHYSAERAQRHIMAQAILVGLYQLGATVINNGAAYSTPSRAAITSGAEQPNPLALLMSSSSATPLQSTTRQHLLALYNAIPQMTAHNGRQKAENSLHAAFVMKVALDCIEPKVIYNIWKTLKEQQAVMTISGSSAVTFPDGSQLLNDQTAEEILRKYIQSNPDRFTSVVDIKTVSGYLPFSFIVGSNESDMLNLILASPLAKECLALHSTTQTAGTRTGPIIEEVEEKETANEIVAKVSTKALVKPGTGTAFKTERQPKIEDIETKEAKRPTPGKSGEKQ